VLVEAITACVGKQSGLWQKRRNSLERRSLRK